MADWQWKLDSGASIVAMHFDGKKNPYLGIKKGNQVIMVAQFISDEDAQYLRDTLNENLLLSVSLKDE